MRDLLHRLHQALTTSPFRGVVSDAGKRGSAEGDLVMFNPETGEKVVLHLVNHEARVLRALMRRRLYQQGFVEVANER